MKKMLVVLIAFLILLVSPNTIREPYILIENPKQYAKRMTLIQWQDKEWHCLNKLWHRESKWDPRADNPKSTAFGIPQILGMDERTPVLTQVDLGLAYIGHRYGTPCLALTHHLKRGWY